MKYDRGKIGSLPGRPNKGVARILGCDYGLREEPAHAQSTTVAAARDLAV